jgi:hypothetical protein
VLNKRLVRGSVAAVAGLAIPVAGVVALGVNPAAAKPTGIVCSKLSGKADVTANTSSTKVTKCTGNTGTKGSTKGTAAPPTTVTIKWANGKSTTTGNVNLSGGSLCPATSTNGPLVADEVESGTVSADNTKSTVIGAATAAEVCVYGSSTDALTLSLAPGTTYSFAKSAG